MYLEVDKTDNLSHTLRVVHGDYAMTKTVDLTFQEIDALFAYDPESGALTRKVRVGQRGRSGADATVIRVAKDGRKQEARYRWVYIQGRPFSAARIAWLLSFGEWPKTRVLFDNGDTLDLRLKNLKEGAFKAIRVEKSDGSVHYRRPREAGRTYELRYHYGLSATDYDRMLAMQGGVCKICGCEEIRRHKDGSPVALHVDHCHDTGRVRALLCHKCNVGIGSFDEDPVKLAKALDYIERHRTEKDVTMIEHKEAS